MSPLAAPLCHPSLMLNTRNQSQLFLRTDKQDSIHQTKDQEFKPRPHLHHPQQVVTLSFKWNPTQYPTCTLENQWSWRQMKRRIKDPHWFICLGTATKKFPHNSLLPERSHKSPCTPFPLHCLGLIAFRIFNIYRPRQRGRHYFSSHIICSIALIAYPFL